MIEDFSCAGPKEFSSAGSASTCARDLSHLLRITRQAADFDRASRLEPRACLGKLDRRLDRVCLNDREAADDFLGLNERPVGDDLRLNDASLLRQAVAGV